jgi:hypothetical protein
MLTVKLYFCCIGSNVDSKAVFWYIGSNTGSKQYV